MSLSNIYSRLSRRSTARGSSTGLVTVGPTKSILFTEGIPEVKIKNTCLMQLTHFILSPFAWLLYAVAKYSHSTFTLPLIKYLTDGTNGCHLVFLYNGPVFKWSVQHIEHNSQIDHLNTEPFENRTSKNSVFKWSVFRSPQ